MQGDVDNIVKLVVDTLSAHIYIDDKEVERVVVQKFEPGNVFNCSNPTTAVVNAITGPKPVLMFVSRVVPLRSCDELSNDRRGSLAAEDSGI